MGPDSGSKLFSQQIPTLLALSATFCGAPTEVSPEVVWEGAGTRFPHPRDVLMWFGFSQSDPTCCVTFTHLSSMGNYLSQARMLFTLFYAYYYYRYLVTYEGTTLSVIIKHK